MSLYIVVGDRTLEVPRAVEAQGGAAVEAWVAEQVAPEQQPSKPESEE